MYIIGEKINGTFKSVREAIKDRNKSVIQELALKQIQAGADALDVTPGVESENPQKDMEWLVKTIREVTNVPLSIDSTKYDVMEIGISLAGESAILNSTTAEPEKLQKNLELAKKYNSKIIALTIDKSGVPLHAEKRIEIAANILTTVLEFGIDISNLFIDAVILPINVAQEHAIQVLETIKQIKSLFSPPPQTILGLSNVSQGAKNRQLIDRTFVTMCILSGLDAAILNPLDKELMDSIITSEILINKNLYCDSFLDAYRKK